MSLLLHFFGTGGVSSSPIPKPLWVSQYSFTLNVTCNPLVSLSHGRIWCLIWLAWAASTQCGLVGRV